MNATTPGPSPPGASMNPPANNLPRPRPWRKLWRDQVFDRRLRRAEPAARWLWTVLQVIPDDHLDGRLVENGCPLTIEEISDAASLEVADGRRAMAYLVDVGLVAEGVDGVLVLPGYAGSQETVDAHRKRVARRSQSPPETPLKTPEEEERGERSVSADILRTVHGKSADSPRTVRDASASKRFNPPSVADVAAYVAEQGFPIDPGAFCDYYASTGWRVGKALMKDWKAAARNWARRERPEDRGRIDRENAELRAMFDAPAEVAR